MQLEASLRDLKRKGFALYEFAKMETKKLFEEVHDVTQRM